MAKTGKSYLLKIIVLLNSSKLISFKWAKQVLTIEQNVQIKERLKQQKKYASTLRNGEKAFIVRWKQTVIKF